MTVPAATVIHVEWRLYARCRGTDLSLWYPPDESRPNPEALAMCSTCPVTDKCLRDALAAEKDRPAAMRFGIFAGLAGYERAVLAGVAQPRPVRVPRPRKQRTPAAPHVPATHCRRGHEWASSAYVAAGKRECRACRTERQRVRRSQAKRADARR